MSCYSFPFSQLASKVCNTSCFLCRWMICNTSLDLESFPLRSNAQADFFAQHIGCSYVRRFMSNIYYSNGLIDGLRLFSSF
jgi:hypothetical protein